MRDGVLIGMAIGAVLGAVLVEGCRPAGEIVRSSKQCVKEKVEDLANAASKAMKSKTTV